MNGIGPRDLDNLAYLFCIGILDSWVYRSVLQSNNNFYGEEYMKNNRNGTLQLIAYIMGGEKDHVLFVVMDENKTSSKISNF